MHGLDDIHRDGVVSRRELLEAGVGVGAIEHALRTGVLYRRYEGVYAMGRRELTVAGQRRAIVLACGRRAVLSHRSAAAAWGIRPGGASRWEVTIADRRRRAPAAPVRTYRNRLSRDEIADLDGLPVTTVPRTLVDLAAVVPPHHLRRAVERTTELDLFDLVQVTALLERHRRRPGTPMLRALLDDFREHGMTRTRSDPEAAMLQLCLDFRLPRPEVNRTRDGREADFRWPAQRLIVEVDGYGTHRGVRAFREDRRKDRVATLAGWRTARFTAHELEHDPARVATELRALAGPGTTTGRPFGRPV